MCRSASPTELGAIVSQAQAAYLRWPEIARHAHRNLSQAQKLAGGVPQVADDNVDVVDHHRLPPLVRAFFG
jgi:hypothetical protein